MDYWDQALNGDLSGLPDIEALLQRRRDESFVGGVTMSGNAGAYEVPLGGHVKHRKDGCGEIVPDGEQEAVMPMLRDIGGLGGFDAEMGCSSTGDEYSSSASPVDPSTASSSPEYQMALAFLRGDWNRG